MSREWKMNDQKGLALACLLFLSISLVPEAVRAEPSQVQNQDIYRDMQFSDKADKIHTLASFAQEQATKKGILVVAFAPWCGWCLKELPHLETLRNQMGENLDILIVSVDQERPTTWKMDEYSQDIYYGPALNAHLEGGGIPQAFLINSEGQIVLHERGYKDWSDPSTIAEIKEKLNIVSQEPPKDVSQDESVSTSTSSNP